MTRPRPRWRMVRCGRCGLQVRVGHTCPHCAVADEVTEVVDKETHVEEPHDPTDDLHAALGRLTAAIGRLTDAIQEPPTPTGGRDNQETKDEPHVVR